MGVKYMNRVHIPEYDINQTNRAYEYKGSVTYVDAPIAGDVILIPPNCSNITAALLPASTSSGKFQTTNANIADVIDDPAGVDWFEWTPGEVATATIDAVLPTTAIRVVCTLGTVYFQLRAQ